MQPGQDLYDILRVEFLYNLRDILQQSKPDLVLYTEIRQPLWLPLWLLFINRFLSATSMRAFGHISLIIPGRKRNEPADHRPVLPTGIFAPTQKSPGNLLAENCRPDHNSLSPAIRVIDALLWINRKIEQDQNLTGKFKGTIQQAGDSIRKN